MSRAWLVLCRLPTLEPLRCQRWCPRDTREPIRKLLLLSGVLSLVVPNNAPVNPPTVSTGHLNIVLI